jgi:crotonobetainyl-CoA:carnitine CoA-transferase CaiB-like acyl-CoA transferase
MQLPGTATTDARLPASPALGEHTCEILQEHGYADTDIESLIRAKVVVDGTRK